MVYKIGITSPALRLILIDEINEATVRLIEQGHRSHLGASEIGRPCERFLFFKFRWFDLKKHSGQMLRLFNRGHEEEIRLKRFMVEAGFRFDESGFQLKFSAVNGHFGGSCDGLVRLPSQIRIKQTEKVIQDYDPEELLIWECKTIKDGKEASRLQDDFFKKVKPVHYAQTSVYCCLGKVNHVLYTSVNKNTDAIHLEIEQGDNELASVLLQKADRIINSKVIPERIGKSASYYECRYCDMCDVCHNGKKPLVNCRSCIQSVPIEDGQWGCLKYGIVIPEGGIKTGCENWETWT